jgi:hypothetical protein
MGYIFGYFGDPEQASTVTGIDIRHILPGLNILPLKSFAFGNSGPAIDC